MKTRTLFCALVAAMMIFVGCDKDEPSTPTPVTPTNNPSVTPNELTFAYNGGTQSVTVNLGDHLYYGATVDEDGEDWCEVETPGDGKVEITVNVNYEFTSRSCTVNCYVADTTKPTEEEMILLPVLVKQDAAVSSGTCQGHEWINLGLPSGTLWATCNVGADTPEEWGYCYKWGEVEPSASSTNNWEPSKYCMGAQGTLTKYNQGETSGYQGYTDDLTELEPMDDAATVNWGDGWCMPTLAQIRELSTYTYWSWETTPNGVKGNRYTSKVNDNSIFIPADADGHYATIWTKSLYAGINAWKFTQGGDTYGIDWDWRCFGKRVRPVLKQ